MSNDLHDRIAAVRQSGGGYDLLQAEIAGETAASLGHHGRQVEAAMNSLRAFDAAAEGQADDRVVLLRRAAKAVWSYFVQRELCGMRDHRWVIKDYGITDEVMVRLGAVER